LLRTLGIKRKGVGFYALRHTFLTIGEEARDQQAAKFIMGHLPDADDMSANYREEFTEARLRAVTDHVRKWLFTKEPAILQDVA
jgi:hypothetical protein